MTKYIVLLEWILDPKTKKKKNMNIIDFHTHAFPDKIARRAIESLEEESDWKSALNGTIDNLLKSMDEAGITSSIIASIATKPDQFEPILKWSKKIRSERIIPFLSVKPDDRNSLKNINLAVKEGFKGIKLHPYYQQFILDDEIMFPIYEEISRNNLILLSHTGFDCAFPKDRICDPIKILRITKMFPELKFVTSHLGAWEDWDEAEKHLIGKPIFMELSFAYGFLEPDRIKSFILRHPKEYMLFGTDSPWADQKQAVQFVKTLKLGSDLEERVFSKNAKKLLSL